jgi:glycosyltransferase involved in cell wall biosynthesis
VRVLVAGWVNSPHVLAWADAVEAAGHDVHIVGRIVPDSELPAAARNIHVLPDNGVPLLRSLAMAQSLAAVAAEVRPDLVHAHWLPEAGWMAARERLRPLICSAWGSDVLGVRGIGRRRSRLALEAAQLVFADSAELARAARELGGGRAPVEVVRWGLDLQRFAPRDRAAARRALNLTADGPLVVSPRGVKNVYNPVLVLEAFARVRARRPDIRLLLKTPSGAVPVEVSKAIERLGLEETVTIMGTIELDQLPAVYAAADVVVSIPSSDSSPRSVWEALACGRPVVVSDLPWARDELVDGRHALFTTLDAASIADAIERALDDDGIGQHGRELAEAMLDPKACTDRIDALYQSVVDRSL